MVVRWPLAAKAGAVAILIDIRAHRMETVQLWEVAMRSKHLVVLLLPLLLAALPAAANAGGDAIRTMADIIMHLNHYPSDSEKQTLNGIIHDPKATAGEKTIAGALMRMRHSVGGDDAAALRALAADAKASAGERELADILLGIHHHPSAMDRQRLQKLIGE